MLTRKALLLTGLVLASALPLTAAAFPHHPQNPDYDLNGDGQITPEEAQAARAAEFPKIDTDGNGFISFAELQTWADAQKSVRFNKLDTDANGSLTEAEFVAGRPQNAPADVGGRIFKLLDVDGNGVLSMQEFKTLIGQDHLIMQFARMDTDGDNQISNAEYLTPPPRHESRSAPVDTPTTTPLTGRTGRR